jgi:D-serine deaminase-like pyridoxal phosphate-dependent protein
MLTKAAVFGGILVAVLLGWSMFNRPSEALQWGTTSIQCLPNGHANATYHIHTKLTIVVDEVPELIPSHIGDTSECMAEVHTHDASGTIHIESVTEKKFTLADFYSVWGKSLDRDGYILRASIKGVAAPNPESIQLEDGADIVLMYTTDSSTES